MLFTDIYDFIIMAYIPTKANEQDGSCFISDMLSNAVRI